MTTNPEQIEFGFVPSAETAHAGGPVLMDWNSSPDRTVEIVCRYGPMTRLGAPIVVGQFWAGDTRVGTC